MQLDIHEIQKILPHRYPFLLVDRITELEPGKSARGIKCVSANEMQFMGHFPEHHVMPGVLIVEALAQTGCVAILSQEEYKGKIVFFAGINKCKFKGQVTPGDVVELECTLTRMRKSIGVGEAVAKVDGKVVVKAELTFAIGE
jgi:3-hydroxyacyl-[acyl-carrier-protein] dehydratase